MSEVARLPVRGGEPRTHVTLSVEDLGAQLADAEDAGFSKALDVLKIWGLERLPYLELCEGSNELRARLYAAYLKKRYA